MVRTADQPFNRIAIYGHRGWAGSAITKALIASGAPIKILHRQSSDVSGLPRNVETKEIDLEDISSLIAALDNIDILISNAGQPTIHTQYALIKAIPQTGVKLFVPSDLGAEIGEQQKKIKALNAKEEIVSAAKHVEIPITIIRPGSMTESTLATLLLGIDVSGNRIVYTGDSKNQKLNMCSLDYVAAAYVDIFTRRPVNEIRNRILGLSEVTAKGAEIAQALERKHGVAPQIFHQSLKQVEDMIDTRLARGDITAVALTYRYPWGEGLCEKLIGDDVWEVEGYPKTTLEELIVEGKLKPYKELPSPFAEGLQTTFV